METNGTSETETIRLTREQVREIDRRATEEYGVPPIVLMENAAIHAADLAWDLMHNKQGRHVLIICGGGNNGGDGLALARHLHNTGAAVSIALTAHPAHFKGPALTNWEIIQKMKLPWSTADAGLMRHMKPGLVVDAVFGTGLQETPRGPFAELVDVINHYSCPVLSIDVPSGLDCDTGVPLGPCVRARATITFVAEKVGFANPHAKQFLGEVWIGDIGCPYELVQQVAAQSPLRPDHDPNDLQLNASDALPEEEEEG